MFHSILLGLALMAVPDDAVRYEYFGGSIIANFGVALPGARPDHDDAAHLAGQCPNGPDCPTRPKPKPKPKPEPKPDPWSPPPVPSPPALPPLGRTAWLVLGLGGLFFVSLIAAAAVLLAILAAAHRRSSDPDPGS